MHTSSNDIPMKRPETGAEAVLMALKAEGVDYLFANAGTDFPPIIEALVRHPDLTPVPVTVPHESVAVGMAHGYYLATGRPQAVMVHVNVGLANATMGILNAANDCVPIILLSGRTPLTAGDRPGSRITPIHYGQEMYDQTALVREATKFDYEMRYGEQGAAMIARAVGLAMSEPRGPVYVSLPREPLMEPFPASAPFPAPPQAAHRPAAPDAAAITEAADLISAARNPIAICQRGDLAGRTGLALSALGLPVIEPFTVRNVMAFDDPYFAGYDPSPVTESDVILVVDTAVPWIERRHRPDATVITLGPDPLFRRLPMRGFRSDLSIVCDPVPGLDALAAAMTRQFPPLEKPPVPSIQPTSPISAEWMSQCLSDILGDGMVYSELGVVPAAMRLNGPNRLFTAPHSGGLGWAMPAALGAQLADRDRLTVACMGDGSYMFANPVVCHQIAEALDLPILTIVKNNGMWNAVRRSVRNAYPDGAAAAANSMPLTSLQPLPDFTAIAGASRAHAERVEHGADLPAALERALQVIREEKRQVLLELIVAVSDDY